SSLSRSLSLHGDSHSIRIPHFATISMAAKSSRYPLRSSQRIDDSQDYETPTMDDGWGGHNVRNPDMDNAVLSQSDFLISSQVEAFLSDSFGSRFNNMNSFPEGDMQFNLSDIPRDEFAGDLPPSHFANGEFEEEKQQFVPIDEAYQPDLQYMDNERANGVYIYSQGLGDMNKFTVAVMPEAKNCNRNYVPFHNLLFVKQGANIPFTFMLMNSETKQGVTMPADMTIRMSLRFTLPVSDDKRIVQRCDVHMKKDNDGAHNTFAFKVIHRNAVYDDASLSVTIPASTVVPITFHCYSSCAGGIDRQAIYLLFELLNEDGSLYQNAEFHLKVSANPTRDAPKEGERKRKEEEKLRRGRAKSEAGSEMGEKRGRKRKTEEMDEMGRDIKRMDSVSPMLSIHTPSPGWNPTVMSAPRVSTTARRNSKLDLRSTSSERMAMESNGSRKGSDDDENRTYTINICGKKKYDEVMKLLSLLERDERHTCRHDEDNLFENLTQLTGDVTISTWLMQYRLAEEAYVNTFRDHNVHTLDDIANVYHPSYFHHSIGIPQEAAANLNKVYLNWLNGNACNGY
ncbi:hypothetical protein PENTCL1PPCAC_6404, partial [Pristionchus entomophagus]